VDVEELASVHIGQYVVKGGARLRENIVMEVVVVGGLSAV
jgi:hypothetical protein